MASTLKLLIAFVVCLLMVFSCMDITSAHPGGGMFGGGHHGGSDIGALLAAGIVVSMLQRGR